MISLIQASPKSPRRPVKLKHLSMLSLEPGIHADPRDNGQRWASDSGDHEKTAFQHAGVSLELTALSDSESAVPSSELGPSAMAI